MSDNINGVRVLAGYSKISDEDGDCFLEVEYRLKPVSLSLLQKLFNIDPNDPDPAIREVAYGYLLNSEQAKALQPYVIDGVIDLDKYTFYLECFATE